jgi:hypothetical protein
MVSVDYETAGPDWVRADYGARADLYPRLYPCYVTFSRHFPTQEQQMQHALAQAIEPSDTKEELAQFLDVFGAWLITAMAETFPAAHTESK